MRIISVGKLPEQVEYEQKCFNCKTIFACKKSEARYIAGEYSPDPREGSYYKVKCPFCNKDLSMSFDKKVTDTSRITCQFDNVVSQFDK